MKSKTFSIYTLGCKLNYSESSELNRQLERHGFGFSTSPDILIINSCAVTSAAVKKARGMVARLNRKFPEAQIIVVGCFAALQPETVKSWPGVSAVFGNADKMHVIPFLLGSPIPTTPPFFSTFSSGERTRSFLKIQDGCDYHCTYCTVARARGESRSDTIKHVLKQIDQIAHLGVKEINLTGVNTGDFGKKNGESFFDLLQMINQQKPVERVRVSSIEPNLLESRILQLFAGSSVLMPHFHIPLQSGSDRILSLMQRRYKRALFEKRVEEIKTLIPDACIAIDIISGFPGETEEDFSDSYSFVESLPISYLHVFTYSKRPNTPAATMTQVQDFIKKERTTKLLELSDRKKRLFYNAHTGQVRPVLFESGNGQETMYGFTDNYLKVKATYQEALINTVVDTRLTEDNMVIED